MHRTEIIESQLIREINQGDISFKIIKSITINRQRLQRSEVKFIDCDITHLKISNVNFQKITFINCVFKGNIELGSLNGNTDIIISNDKQIDSTATISIENSAIKKIQLKKVSVNEFLFINNTCHEFNASDSSIEEKLEIDKSKITNITFSDCNIGNELIITNGLLDSIAISKTNSKKLIMAPKSRAGSKINFSTKESNFHNFNLESDSIAMLEFYNTTIMDSLSVSSNNGIDCINIKSPKPDVKINNLAINSPSLGTLYITGYMFSSIRLAKLNSISDLTLHNSEISTEFDLTGINISKLTFDILNIKNAYLKIHRTIFDKDRIDLKNVEWSLQNKAYELDREAVDKDVDNYIFQLQNLKESYRVLKVYYMDKHNFFDAMLFSSNELRIEQRIKSLKTWRISFSSAWYNFGDWLVLSTNKLFSNFGLSWIRPLVWWGLVFHLIPICFILNNSNLGITTPFDFESKEYIGVNSEATSEGIKLYLKLLFPFHDSTQIVELEGKIFRQDLWDVGIGIPDFLLRIFSPYFIFLFIRGTRKFNFKVG